MTEIYLHMFARIVADYIATHRETVADEMVREVVEWAVSARAASHLQALIRGYTERRIWVQQRAACIAVQRHARGHMAFAAYTAQRRGAQQLQSLQVRADIIGHARINV